MPGFVGHTAGNAVALIGTTAYMLHDRWSIADTAAIGAGIIVSTLVLSPDMDLFTSKSMDDWGILRYFWFPYAKLVKHRNALHTPILGTAVRWAYFIAILAIAIVPLAIFLRRVGFGITFQGDVEDILWYLGYLLDVFIGGCIADGVHLALDAVTTPLKRMGIGRERRRARLAMADDHDHEHEIPWNNRRHQEWNQRFKN
jgi:uncharacterized metal-binding protein